MPVYVWAGRTRQGTRKKGVLEAINEGAVMAHNVYDTLVSFDTDKRNFIGHFAQFWKRIDDKNHRVQATPGHKVS